MDLSPDQYHDDSQPLTEEDLDAVASAIESAEAQWNKVAYLGTPKMPCPECGGSGQVYSGSLGSFCPTCEGARVVDHPSAGEFDGPDFVGMRRALGTYGNALADHALPDGHRAKKGLALPAASTIVRAEVVAELERVGKQRVLAAQNLPTLALPEAKKKKAGSLGDLDDSEFTDDELDEME